MKKKIVVTSALPYANGSLHVGHLVEYIQTDIFVRALRLMGEDVIYCCADDTHGTPIMISAEKLGITPEELIKKYYKEHTEDFAKFSIKFDSYYSTNSPENKEYSDRIFKKLDEKGLIYKKNINQIYCKKCKRFLPDRYVKGECPKCGALDQYGDVCEKCSSVLKAVDLVSPRCAECGTKPVQKKSEHYFFKLSSCSKDLEKWLTTNKNLQPEIVNYIMNWIKEGLEDWDITRDGPYFGFKIPGEKDKYYYVWLDAPVGYISSTANCCKNKSCKVDDYWKSRNGEVMHFIGKDIIYFHFLFWPAMLMNSGFNIPKDIVVHGFLTVNGEKMSKSRGTFLTAKDFLKMYDPELLRFDYASMLSKTMADVDLSFKDFVGKINNELVANIANFCYRTLSYLNKALESSITEIDEDKEVIESVRGRIDKVLEAYRQVDLKEALKLILEISSIGNKYMQDKQPWKLIKEDKEETRKVLGTCINIAKILSILLSPVMPKYCEQLKKQLNLEGAGIGDLNFETKHHKISKAEILITKIKEKTTANIFPLDLKVAEIKEVKNHPDAEKLFVMKIDAGEERNLVAGLRNHYKPEELLGKKVVLVANLKPAKLRGVLSRGMLLAADDGKNLKVLEVKEAKLGTPARIEGYENNKEQIKLEDFEKVKLTIKNGKAVFEDVVLKADGEEVTAEGVEDNAEVS